MTFERSVFINCPFDKDFAPLLQAILFCVVVMGFEPRLASERNDSGETRLDKIRSIIEGSKYSIHDLSRCQAKRKGEMFRLNMPFELGIDWAVASITATAGPESASLSLRNSPIGFRPRCRIFPAAISRRTGAGSTRR